MTSLIAWVGVDSRGPASFYFASDSRVSWSHDAHWDAGRKLFNCRESPDLFGYCGDVLFPSLFLNQWAHAVDLGAAADHPPDARHLSFVATAQGSLGAYPPQQRRPFTVLHSSREESGMASVFHLWRTDWNSSSGWSDEKLDLPTESVLVLAVGSGTSTITRYDSAWQKTEAGRTSRAVFSAFCDSLASGHDRFSGGPPQLVGLYRTGAGESFGVIYQDRRYLLGVQIPAEEAGRAEIEWRNELFERCDGVSMQRLTGAQRHSRPRQFFHSGERAG